VKAHLTRAELRKIHALSHGKLHPPAVVTLHRLAGGAPRG